MLPNACFDVHLVLVQASVDKLIDDTRGNLEKLVEEMRADYDTYKRESRKEGTPNRLHASFLSVLFLDPISELCGSITQLCA